MMIDNRKVKDNHQQGIERVKQRKKENECNYQPGKMHNKPDQKAHWRRTGSQTPKTA